MPCSLFPSSSSYKVHIPHAEQDLHEGPLILILLLPKEKLQIFSPLKSLVNIVNNLSFQFWLEESCDSSMDFYHARYLHVF